VPHYLLSRTLFHKIIDKMMPDNCRAKLHVALQQNHSACVELVCLLSHNEENVISALKNDRRKYDRIKMDRIS
jgi:hypothetical protein